MLAAAAPTLLIAALAVLGSVPAVFLPETAELELPDTVEEMERCGVLDTTMSTIYIYDMYMYRFGTRDKLCWMPCFKTRDRFKEAEEGKGGDNNWGHADSRG